MTISAFNISFQQIERLLKDFGLFRMKSIPLVDKKGVSESFIKATAKDNYYQIYNCGRANYDFDFLLHDESFFQFEIYEGETITLRYAFFQNPISFCSYEEYVQQEIERSGLDYTIEEVGFIMQEEYEQFLNEQVANGNFSTLRYDCSKSGHRPLIHSVSHMHIGHSNNIRIPIERTISPMAFVLFTIKHVYYEIWKSKVESDLDFIKDLLIKSNCGEQNLKGTKLWDEIESMELIIT